VSPPAKESDRPRPWRAIHAVWVTSCLALVSLLILVRWARYTPWGGTAGVDGVLRELMVFEGQAALWPWAYSMLESRVILLAAAIALVGLHRRLAKRLVTRIDGVWHLTPVASALIVLGLLWLHFLLDLNPTVALACATSLVLLSVTERRWTSLLLRRSGPLAVWATFVACWLAAAGDSVDRLAIVVWMLVLLGTQRYLAGRVDGRDLTLVRVAAIIPMNLFAAMLPLVVPLHGGRHLGDGLAYSFCEVPGRRTLYAAIPVCDSIRADYDDCRAGRIVEYDLEGMQPVAAHKFFSPGFYGRFELLACLDDEVQVAVQDTVYQGRKIIQTALAFPVADPEKFNPAVAGERLGTVIAWDRERDAVFYGGEFSNRVVRYDRRTGQFDETASQDFVRDWYQPVSLQAYRGSLALYTTSIHPRRNRLYVAEWMQGRYAYALDLTTRRVVRRYDVGGGGALGVTVDPERDRMFVSSLWGLEVFDLATDRLIARKRMGFGTRPPVVDAVRNRLYVSSMAEGKIRILDRDTLAVIGQIPIGIGSRFPHLSLDGKWFFASSAAAHYYWDADTLAAAR